MLSKQITALLSIEYLGLFDDQNRCFEILAAKRDSGDADTPPELTEGVIFDLSPDLFIWVTERHLQNNSAHLVAKDVMSNVSLAGLTGVYGEIVEMLAAAGHVERAAQIWRADVASHMDVFREFGRAHKAVERYESLPEAKRVKAAPDRYQRDMARKQPKKKQAALDAIEGFEHWASRFRIADRHLTQIAHWKTELLDARAPKLPAPDKSPMTETLFWELNSRARSSSVGETVLRLEDLLVAYTPKAIRDGAKRVQARLSEAYREEVWALAFLVHDGCSDDAFEDFRNWMILAGEHTYHGIITDPDAFDPAHLEGADIGAAGSLMSAFENAYIARSGKPLILPRGKTRKIIPDESRFEALLPSLAARLERLKA